VIRTLPLALRNRLAATILEAVGDVQARRELAPRWRRRQRRG